MKDKYQTFISLSSHLLTSLVIVLILFFTSSSSYAAGDEKLHRKAQQEMDKGNFDIAEDLYQQIISKDTKDVKAYIGLATAYLKRRNLNAAFEAGIKVLELDTKNARARAIVGTALLRSGYVDRASDQLLYALQFNQRDDLALASSAEIDLYESRTAEAYQKLRLATYIRPSEGDYWLILARAASRQEFFKEASEALRQFLQNSPKTDIDRRARIEGVIRFYSYLGNTHLYQVRGKSSSIPLDIKLRRPYLQVKVNGKETLRFVIDTGAGLCVISPEAAAKIGVKEIARGGEARAVGGEGAFSIVYGLIDEMQIGDIKISLVPTYIRKVHAPSTAKAEDIADGYLGLSLLGNFLMTMDYKANELELVIPDEDSKENKETVTPAANSTVVPFRTTESGLISVEGKINDELTLNFIFDSGATSTVISHDIVDAQKWESKILKDTVKVIGAAGFTENVKLMLGKVQIIDLLRENMRMPILNLSRINEQAGFEQQGILGGDFLYHCRIQIDFRRLQLTLTPSTGLVKRVGEASLLEKEAK
ncbi:MAG: aspartyl protease family protein [Acidobacteria bacterium]|nr:aspartyl protease family protein [Acidobacteriota bacterium]